MVPTSYFLEDNYWADPTYRFKWAGKQWYCPVSNGLYGQPTDTLRLAQ